MGPGSSPVRAWKRSSRALPKLSKFRSSVSISPRITYVKSCTPSTAYLQCIR